VSARIEILLPSTGSIAIAGAKGRLARIASSFSVSGTAFAASTAFFGFGEAASSPSIGGGSMMTGRGSADSIVCTSVATAGRFEGA
jgi:hypothetical protein